MTETAFKTGSTYECRSASDHDTVYRFTVTARTARFITTTDRWGDVRRVGVKTSSDGTEYALPHGSYANAPVIRANRPAEELTVPSTPPRGAGADGPNTGACGVTGVCFECGRRFDLSDPADAGEFVHGHDCEAN